MSVKNILKSGKNRACKFISRYMRLSRVIAAVLAFAMIIGLALFVNPLLGYPLSAPFFKLKAQNYIKKNYGDMGYVMESFQDFHDGQFFAVAAKPGSLDSRFTVHLDADGYIHDGYMYDVLRCFSVRDRLQKEYSEFADSVLKSPKFPYDNVHSKAELAIAVSDLSGKRYNGYPSVISHDILELDGIYDIRELGSRAGYLRVLAYPDEITAEKAAEILLETDRLMTKGGVTYYMIDLILEVSEHPSEGDEYFELHDFRRCDIYEENLTERVAEAGTKGEVKFMYLL